MKKISIFLNEKYFQLLFENCFKQLLKKFPNYF